MLRTKRLSLVTPGLNGREETEGLTIQEDLNALRSEVVVQLKANEGLPEATCLCRLYTTEIPYRSMTKWRDHQRLIVLRLSFHWKVLGLRAVGAL